MLPLDGGEAERVTDMPTSVASPKWLPDGRRVVFAAHVVAGAESPADTKKALEAREKSKLKARTSESRLFRYWDRFLTDDEYPHLFVVDLETKAVRDLLPGSKRYFGLQDGAPDFDVSPDGETVVFAANDTESPHLTLDTDLFAVAISGGPVRNLTADNPAEDHGPVFSPDGRLVAYGRQHKDDGWPDYDRLALLELATSKTTVLTEGWENSAGDWTFTPDGKELVFHAEARARVNVYRIPVSGGTPREIFRGGTTAGAEVTPAGAVIFQQHTISRPPELASVALDGTGFRYLTSVNDARMAALALGEVKEQTFKGAAGEDVQMYVVLPPGYEPGKRYPLVQLDPRRPGRNVRRLLPLSLERPGLRRTRLRRRDGELPRLVELRAGVRRVDPRRAPGQAVHGRDARDGRPGRRRASSTRHAWRRRAARTAASW